MAEQHDQHKITYKLYLMTWGWLLVLTALALGLGYAPINERLKRFFWCAQHWQRF